MSNRRTDPWEYVTHRLKRAKFEIILAATCSLGSGFAFVAIQKVSKIVAVAVAVVYILVVVLMILYKLSQDAKEERMAQELANGQKEADRLKVELEKKTITERELTREVATSLLSKTVLLSTQTSRHISESLQKIPTNLTIAAADRPDGEKSDVSEGLKREFEGLKRRVIDQVLQQLRIIFESDSRGSTTTVFPQTYFKAALFEPAQEGGVKSLQRTHYDYPPGVEPDPETGQVIIETVNLRCGHVLAYRNREIIIVEDIGAELDKPAEQGRWVDLRRNQSKEYKSMVCVPILRGRRGSEDRKVLAVLVIDTNRERYFKENDPGFAAFLGTILGPFRTLISIAFDFETFDTTICGLCVAH